MIEVGATYRFVVQFNRITDGEPFNPSDVTITIVAPDGSDTDYTSSDNLGTLYYEDVLIDQAGIWLWYASTTDITASRTVTSVGEIWSIDLSDLMSEALDDQGYTSVRASYLDNLNGIVSNIVNSMWSLSVASATVSGIGNWIYSTLGAVATKVGLIDLPDHFTFETVVDPVINNFTIVRGDSYTTTSGRPLPTWSSDDWSVYDLANAQNIQFIGRYRQSNSDPYTIITKELGVLSPTEFFLELTSLETGAFPAGTYALHYDIQATLSGGDIVTLIRGKITVLQDMRAVT